MIFTDTEHRILLSALSRERKVCEEIDNDKVICSNTKMLVPIVDSIERKINKIQRESDARGNGDVPLENQPKIRC